MATDAIDRTDDTADAALAARLRQIVGGEHVFTDARDRLFYSTDLSFRANDTAALVIQPRTIEELAQAVEAAAAADLAIVARGGGMSYTSGYTPERAATMLVDMRRMNRIHEINTDDMYVIVEAGCTWKELYEALAPHQVHTPYWGPLSGMYATVGGALSQNSLFHGSGVGGTAAESVIGLKVVLADGEILTTGSWAHRNSSPFWRHFGPDVTGLFTADTGAFGLKAIVALRLVTAPRHTGFLSYKCDTLGAMLAAQVRIARLGIASECYGFDPYIMADSRSRASPSRKGCRSSARSRARAA